MSNDVLGQLQSREQVELLDAIDKLRLEGCSTGELDLPQLIVCGDQSSGKSSVLEAISHVRFPAADTFCTRFASELRLRKATMPSFSVTLVPAAKRSDTEKAYISKFAEPAELTALEDFRKVVELAGQHIDGLHQDGRPESAFYPDKLVAVIHGPHLPPLTLVDLPGLIHTSSRKQSPRDIAMVKEILNTYMSDRSSIILAVLAADNNIANQAVLELARVHDHTGSRTLGIITKPDKVDTGSGSEAHWIKCARNEEIRLQLGWHVLKNRAFEHTEASPGERDAMEARFLESSNWAVLPESHRGIANLRARLSGVLLQSVCQSLPGLSQGIRVEMGACQTTLAKLGQPKVTKAEQQKYLTEISFHLRELVKASAHGHYEGEFYHAPDATVVASRKLRSRLQDTLGEFAARMISHGHLYEIKESSPGDTGAGDTAIDLSTLMSIPVGDVAPLDVTRHSMVLGIDDYMKHNRGCELPGLLNSEVVTHLFKIQSSPWEALSHSFVERCWSQVSDFLEQALQHVAPQHTCDAILEGFAKARLEDSRQDVFAKLDELMQPYRKSHLITLNKQYFMQKSSSRPIAFAQPLESDGAPSSDHLEQRSGISAAWQALNCMEAYYSIASLTFAETVATLAIENCLVESLLSLFTPMTVPDLDDDTLAVLTAEPANLTAERRMNEAKLKTLREVSFVIHKHAGRTPTALATTARLATAGSPPQTPSQDHHIEAEPVNVVNAAPESESCPGHSRPKALRQSFLLQPDVLTPPHTPPKRTSPDTSASQGYRRTPSPLRQEHSATPPSQDGSPRPVNPSTVDDDTRQVRNATPRRRPARVTRSPPVSNVSPERLAGVKKNASIVSVDHEEEL